MTETEQILENARRKWLEATMGSGRPEWMYAIRPGQRLAIGTPHGHKRSGRVVMAGPAGWVLNLGGKHGTPGIANETNIVRRAA